jgi:hypothetical protein
MSNELRTPIKRFRFALDTDWGNYNNRLFIPRCPAYQLPLKRDRLFTLFMPPILRSSVRIEMDRKFEHPRSAKFMIEWPRNRTKYKLSGPEGGW